MTWPFEQLEIAPEIHVNETMSRRVNEATRLLQRKVGKSAQRLQAKWAMINPQEVRLTLADSTGNLSTDFTAAELVPEFRLRRRLSRLWRDLLRIRLEIQLERIVHPEEEVAVP